MRVNIGCGKTPCKGWRNFDNSISVKLSRILFFDVLLYKLKIIDGNQYTFIKTCRENNIEYGNVAKKIPLANNSVEVLYSSHMMEHLDRDSANHFLSEARRVLRPNGIIRLALPDLKKLVEEYIQSEDADKFLTSTHLCHPAPKSWIHKFKFLLTGIRYHQWMYDGQSLRKLLESHGFIKILVIPAGETRIPNPGLLDLKERSSESFYIEAECP